MADETTHTHKNKNKNKNKTKTKNKNKNKNTNKNRNSRYHPSLSSIFLSSLPSLHSTYSKAGQSHDSPSALPLLR